MRERAGKQGIFSDARKKDYFKIHQDISAGTDQTYHKLVACLSIGDCLIDVEACKFQFCDACIQILPSVCVSFACPGSRYSTISTCKLLYYALTSRTFVCKEVEKLIQPTVKQTLCQGNIMYMSVVKRNKYPSGHLFL